MKALMGKWPDDLHHVRYTRKNGKVQGYHASDKAEEGRSSVCTWRRD